MEQNTPTVFLFAGQGCQYYNMGEELYQSNETFRNTLLTLDLHARQLMGASVLDTIYGNHQPRGAAFDELRFTNPAIFMIQYALAAMLQEDLQLRPDYVLGNSLGEMVAAAVSGAVAPENMLSAVIRQAEVLSSYCRKGTMISILHDNTIFRKTPELYTNSTLAAVSYDQHFTIAAAEDRVQQIIRFLDQQEMLYMQLPVQYAFHSQLIDIAEEKFKETFDNVSFIPPAIKFIAGVHGQQLSTLDANYCWQAVRAPMKLNEAVHFLETKPPCRYIDCSPSGTIKNILNKIVNPANGSKHYGIMSPFRQEIKNLQQLRELSTSASI